MSGSPEKSADLRLGERFALPLWAETAESRRTGLRRIGLVLTAVIMRRQSASGPGVPTVSGRRRRAAAPPAVAVALLVEAVGEVTRVEEAIIV